MRELCNEIVQKLSIVMEDLELEENKWQNLLGNSTDKKHGDITLPCHTFSKIFRNPKPLSSTEEFNEEPICKEFFLSPLIRGSSM